LLICGPLAFLAISVTGAIAALGDTLFAATSLSQGLHLDLSPSAHIFVRLRIWHPIVAALLGCLLVAFAAAIALRKDAAPLTRRLAWAVALLTFLQAGGGVINVLLLAPVWMQITHLFIADSLWIALVLLTAEEMISDGQRLAGVRAGSGVARPVEGQSVSAVHG
jgi:heme A synthase